jgi:hypothetical protein
VTLTNRELAENATWIAAVTWLECTFCWYLSQDLELVRPAMPCPHCTKSGRARMVFPDMSSDRLLEMISYFYARALERNDDTQAGLVEDLRKAYGREYGIDTAVSTALEAQRLMRASDGSGAAYEKVLEAVGLGLDLKTREDARKAYVLLLQYSDTQEEHQVVVLFTAAMLERLFGQLLLRMFVRSGNDWEKARAAVRNLRRHEDREKGFAKLVGVSLEKAVGQSGVAGFYAGWKEIRNLRNKFLHGMPFVIHVSDTERAFELAKDAFRLFAHPHNEFCVTSKVKEAMV